MYSCHLNSPPEQTFWLPPVWSQSREILPLTNLRRGTSHCKPPDPPQSLQELGVSGRLSTVPVHILLQGPQLQGDLERFCSGSPLYTKSLCFVIHPTNWNNSVSFPVWNSGGSTNLCVSSWPLSDVNTRSSTSTRPRCASFWGIISLPSTSDW